MPTVPVNAATSTRWTSLACPRGKISSTPPKKAPAPARRASSEDCSRAAQGALQVMFGQQCQQLIEGHVVEDVIFLHIVKSGGERRVLLGGVEERLADSLLEVRLFPAE